MSKYFRISKQALCLRAIVQKEKLTKVFKLYLATSILGINFSKYNCTKDDNFLDNIFQRKRNNI